MISIIYLFFLIENNKKNKDIKNKELYFSY